MKIDTLLLSGCSTKLSAYIGVFQCLFEKKIINMKQIKKIVCCSSGSIITILLILNYSFEFMKYLTNKLNYESLFNYEDLNDLFDSNGLFNNNIDVVIKNLLFNKYKLYDISLIDLYNKTNIECEFKVFNISKTKETYISYKNYPTMSILTVVKMTTSIPIIFKPVKYENDYYIDGGINGSFPYQNNNIHNNYLGIYIHSFKRNLKCNIDMMNNIDYIYNIYKITNMNLENNILDNGNDRIIKININNINFYNFDISNNQKEQFIDIGYKKTLEHINRYNLI